MIDERSGQVLRRRIVVPGTSGIVSAAISGQSRRLFALDYALQSGRQEVVYVLDTRTGAVATPIAIDAPASALALDDARHRLIVGTERDLLVFDTVTGRRLWSIALPYVDAIAVDPASGTLAVDSTPVISPVASPTWLDVVREHLPFLDPARHARHGISIITLSP